MIVGVGAVIPCIKVAVDTISDACGEGDEGVITGSAISDGGAGDGVVTGVAAEPGVFERALVGACDF